MNELPDRSVLARLGHTPIVRLNRISDEVQRELFVKLELLNVGGSHKARIALSMVLAAEQDGTLRRDTGQTIIEPTGGNTGVGLAIVAAVLGYRLVLVIPDNYSPAKQRLLAAYGAQIVLSDHRRGANSHGEKAVALLFDHPDWVLLNQQANAANPSVHFGTTAVEILDDLVGELPDALVAGVGTGGHLTGVGRRLRAAVPQLRIVAVVPEGCSFKRDQFRQHDLQGLAVGLVPRVLDVDLIDDEVEVGAAAARAMVVRLMRTEGLGVGLSSAANVVAAMKYSERLPVGARILTFAYDGVADYLDVLDGVDTDVDTDVDAIPAQQNG
jgi:cysteine synthase A